MPALKFEKVTVLPGTLTADTFYFVENGTYSESYLTNASGVARSVGNSAMINALADARISTALSSLNSLEIVADIAARNALTTINRNFMVLVQNATGDPSVASGAAMYAFRNSDNAFIKVSEYEGLDVVLNWSAILGGPTSSPTLIDDAVNKRHTHANLTQLNKIGEDGGGSLTYNGTSVSASWNTANW
jgi:hypothetical protein